MILILKVSALIHFWTVAMIEDILGKWKLLCGDIEEKQ